MPSNEETEGVISRSIKEGIGHISPAASRDAFECEMEDVVGSMEALPGPSNLETSTKTSISRNFLQSRTSFDPRSSSRGSLCYAESTWSSLTYRQFPPVSDQIEMTMVGPSGNPRIIKKATINGFLQYLLRNPADTEQQDTFFIGHLAFISPENVFHMLVRQFDEASSFRDHVRDDIQINVMLFVKNWLTNQNVIITDLFTEIKDFIETRALGSSDLGKQISRLILNQASPSPLAKPLNSPGLYTTSQLAVALTALERRTYLCIFASEYVAYARNHPAHCPNLQHAITLNDKIINWVKFSIVKLDDPAERSTMTEFFLETAQECQKIRNFSSMCAIAKALQETMPRNKWGQYETLATFLEQGSNYSTYKAAVRCDGSKGCIPCHDVHIHDIHKELLKGPDVDGDFEPPLFNIEKWIRLKETASDALRSRSIPLEYNEDGLQTAIGCLQSEIEAVTVDDDFRRYLLRNSAVLAKEEAITLTLTESVGLQ